MSIDGKCPDYSHRQLSHYLLSISIRDMCIISMNNYGRGVKYDSERVPNEMLTVLAIAVRPGI